MTSYHTRAEWTNTARGGDTLTNAVLRGLVYHYPGRPAAYGVLTQAAEAEILRGIRTYHVNTNRWTDIGYQVMVSQAGRVWDLRGINRVPVAHGTLAAGDENRQWGAVLLLVGNNEKPSAAMIEAVNHLRHEVWLKRWPGTTDLRGHRQVPGAQTQCPGDIVIRLIADGTLTAKPRGTGNSPNGDIMSWNEDLARDSKGAKITNLADTTMPGTWGRTAAQLVGYGAAGFAYLRNGRWPKPAGTPAGEWGFISFVRWAYAHALTARDEGRERGRMQKQILETNTAILAAVTGSSSQDILERISQHAAEQAARDAQAAQERAALSDKLDAATAERADLVQLINDYQSGKLDADRVVARIGELLSVTPPPAE